LGTGSTGKHIKDVGLDCKNLGGYKLYSSVVEHKILNKNHCKRYGYEIILGHANIEEKYKMKIATVCRKRGSVLYLLKLKFQVKPESDTKTKLYYLGHIAEVLVPVINRIYGFNIDAETAADRAKQLYLEDKVIILKESIVCNIRGCDKVQ